MKRAVLPLMMLLVPPHVLKEWVKALADSFVSSLASPFLSMKECSSSGLLSLVGQLALPLPLHLGSHLAPASILSKGLFTLSLSVYSFIFNSSCSVCRPFVCSCSATEICLHSCIDDRVLLATRRSTDNSTLRREAKVQCKSVYACAQIRSEAQATEIVFHE